MQMASLTTTPSKARKTVAHQVSLTNSSSLPSGVFTMEMRKYIGKSLTSILQTRDLPPSRLSTFPYMNFKVARRIATLKNK